MVDIAKGGDGGNTLDGTAVSKFKITICDFKGSGYEYDTHGNCDWAKGEVSYYEVNYIKQTLETIFMSIYVIY